MTRPAPEAIMDKLTQAREALAIDEAYTLAVSQDKARWPAEAFEAGYRAALAALSDGEAVEPVAWLANCCACGRIVDTRETSEGGDNFGCQLDDDRWTCSPDCWETVVEPAARATEGGQNDER